MRPVIRDTKRAVYCGPMSIAAVTGERASTVLATIQRHREALGFGHTASGRRRAIMGMMPSEVLGTLQRLGYPAEYVSLRGRPTLAAWLREQKPPGAQIVHVTGHYTAVDGRHMIDTKTKGQPVALAKAPHRRARVKGYIVIGPRRIG